MSKTKSTPGPWNVGSLPPAGWRYICDSKGETLAAVAEWDEDGTLHLEFPNAKANARLIAAAPDLLAALKETTDAAEIACRMLKRHGFSEEFIRAGHAAGIADNFGERARAAIAKAEGR